MRAVRLPLLVPSASRRRRAREARHGALRDFAQREGWSVAGLVEDLSVRYAVPSLLGATSAQSELAVVGSWRDHPARLVLAVARPVQPSARRAPDVQVLLTVLDVGPRPVQYVAEVRSDAVDVVGLASRSPAEVAPALEDARRSGGLLPGDTVTAGELEVVHARRLGVVDPLDDPRPVLDLLGRLRA